MIKMFDKGYGIDRTYGTLREKHFDVSYDDVALEYVNYHKEKHSSLEGLVD